MVAGRGIEPLHLGYGPNQSTVTVPRKKAGRFVCLNGAGLEPASELPPALALELPVLESCYKRC